MMNKKTIIIIAIGLILLLAVLWVGATITGNIYKISFNYCNNTNETIDTPQGEIDCYQWNIGNWTTLS